MTMTSFRFFRGGNFSSRLGSPVVGWEQVAVTYFPRTYKRRCLPLRVLSDRVRHTHDGAAFEEGNEKKIRERESGGRSLMATRRAHVDKIRG